MADLRFKHAADVTREDPEVGSIGKVRLIAGDNPGEERDYQAGDEALVESGEAVWVCAPVHTPSAGRRLDHDAEREATPRDGVEAYPPAEPTTSARRTEALVEGVVAAHSDTGLAAKLADARTQPVSKDGDAAQQAKLGGHGARSIVAVKSELPADQPTKAEKAPGK